MKRTASARITADICFYFSILCLIDSLQPCQTAMAVFTAAAFFAASFAVRTEILPLRLLLGLLPGAAFLLAPMTPLLLLPGLAWLYFLLIVTLGGFVTNAIYCLYQNQKNKTWGDYAKKSVWGNNLLFCLLAGALWYSQFFGLSLGRSFFEAGGTMDTLSFCILMALNVVFSNVWGIILKEWKGCSQKTITVLIIGIVVLVISCFLPQLV